MYPTEVCRRHFYLIKKKYEELIFKKQNDRFSISPLAEACPRLARAQYSFDFLSVEALIDDHKRIRSVLRAVGRWLWPLAVG